jgi:hypothetical protein
MRLAGANTSSFAVKWCPTWRDHVVENLPAHSSTVGLQKAMPVSLRQPIPRGLASNPVGDEAVEEKFLAVTSFTALRAVGKDGNEESASYITRNLRLKRISLLFTNEW